MTDLEALIRERERPMARWNVIGEPEERIVPLRRRQYVLGELEHLWGTDNFTNIAARLGYTSKGSMARTLAKWGEHHLAREVTNQP